MKATLFLSSIFFLLGLKVSSIIDLRGKANAVDNIITTKIIKSNPIKAFPLFKDTNNNEEIRIEKKEEPVNSESEIQEVVN